MAEVSLSASASAVAEILARNPHRARFVAEIGETLRRSGAVTADVEKALVELESSGGIIVRSHACADPHLDSADLRIAVLVAADPVEGDPLAAAIAMIDETWQRWLGDYLANHRCM